MRNILIVTSLLFASLTINAQEFNAGMYSSAVISQLYGDNYGGFNKLGFAGGFYVNRFVKKNLAPQLGFRYIQKGSREVNDVVDYRCVLHYIEMPITLRYVPKDRLDLDIEAGLTFGYLIKGYEKLNGFEIIDAPPFNKFELGVTIGTNYEFSEKLFVGVHFSNSLLFIRPHSQDYNNMDKGQHNTLLMLTLGYKFSSWK